MTHTKSVEVHEGEFTAHEMSDVACTKCGVRDVEVHHWESSCGGYEDDKFTCRACGHYWWVEGPDS